VPIAWPVHLKRLSIAHLPAALPRAPTTRTWRFHFDAFQLQPSLYRSAQLLADADAIALAHEVKALEQDWYKYFKCTSPANSRTRVPVEMHEYARRRRSTRSPSEHRPQELFAVGSPRDGWRRSASYSLKGFW
jgi:hypothetical protein